jgi:hypothetical protein
LRCGPGGGSGPGGGGHGGSGSPGGRWGNGPSAGRWSGSGGGGGGAGWSDGFVTTGGGNGGSGIGVLEYATNNSFTLTANNGRVNLPSNLTLSNINSIMIIDGNTNRDLTFNSLTLVNTSLDLVNRKLTAASLITDVNSAITNSSGSAKLHVTGTASIAGSITTGRDYFDVANSLTVKNVTTGLDEVVSTEWGQYYAGAVTLTGTASLISNNYNIGFNSTVQGNYDLTVNAGLGFVMFKNRVGADPLLETNTTVLSLNTTNGNDYVAFGNRNVKQIQKNKKKYNRSSNKSEVHLDSFDILINKYLTNYIFSEDVMNAVKPANPNAPADPKEQAKIKLARQKKVQSLQKTQTKPATQAEADAYELGRTEKI